jgi:hypothetical protein
LSNGWENTNLKSGCTLIPQKILRAPSIRRSLSNGWETTNLKSGCTVRRGPHGRALRPWGGSKLRLGGEPRTPNSARKWVPRPSFAWAGKESKSRKWVPPVPRTRGPGTSTPAQTHPPPMTHLPPAPLQIISLGRRTLDTSRVPPLKKEPLPGDRDPRQLTTDN